MGAEGPYSIVVQDGVVTVTDPRTGKSTRTHLEQFVQEVVRSKVELPSDVLDTIVARIDEHQLRIYELAEEAAAMPLDALIAYLDAIQGSRGLGVKAAEWMTIQQNVDFLRRLAEPLRALARTYCELEAEHHRDNGA